MDEDDNGKFRLERVKHQDLEIFDIKLIKQIRVIFTHFQVVGDTIQVGENLNSVAAI